MSSERITKIWTKRWWHTKTFCKILDKAAEDLSNLRKSTKASGSDAIELSDEYIECLLSSFSESEKLHTKYLIEHGYSSLKLPNYNSVNFKCQQKGIVTKSGTLPSTFAKSGFSILSKKPEKNMFCLFMKRKKQFETWEKKVLKNII